MFIGIFRSRHNPQRNTIPLNSESLKCTSEQVLWFLVFIAAEIKYCTAHFESLYIQNFAFHPPSAAVELNTMAMMNSRCIIVRCRSLFPGKSPSPNASFNITNIHIQEGLVSSLFPVCPNKLIFDSQLNTGRVRFPVPTLILISNIFTFVSLTWKIDKILNLFFCISRI